MSNVSFEVHESHIQLWENKDWRYAILMGGRGNGRSGTASRYAISQLLGKEYTRGAIMRATREDIRASCWGEIKDRLNEQGIASQFHITENDMFIERGANSLRAHGFRASSGSLTARLKSLAGYNFVWIEEAEEIGEDEFRTLDDTLRTVKGRIRIIFSLNTPPKNHWIIKKWFDLEPSETQGFYIPRLKQGLSDIIYLGGTWKENEPNLDIHTIERYKAYQYNNPAYFWQVIQGLSPEEVRGKIFTGWRQIEAIPEGARLLKLGLDWGWYPDPVAVIALYYYNGEYIVDEVIYGTNIEDEMVASTIKQVNGWENIYVVCGADEPKSIELLRKYRIKAESAISGKGSVEFRIKATATKKVAVTRKSGNIWQGYENYAWAEDKDGNPKGEPAHAFSDCFAPETLVHTVNGRKRIDSLVGKEGFLYSSDGTIQRFYNVRATKRNIEVVSLSFNDGDTLTITPDHLLLLPNGQWIQASLLCVSDMIQSSMYEQNKIQWNNFYKVSKQKLLLWLHERKKMVFTSLYLVFSQWKNTKELSYSSQGWQQREQFSEEFRIKAQGGSFIRTYDTSTKGVAKRMGKTNNPTCKEMAWVKRGDKVSLVAWKKELEKQKTFFERMFSLPQAIRKTYQSIKRQILWSKLPNESQTKKIEGIIRGFRAVTYNMEVENTHCLMANGVIAHNCMDAVTYAMASINPLKEYIKTPNLPPREKRNIAV